MGVDDRLRRAAVQLRGSLAEEPIPATPATRQRPWLAVSLAAVVTLIVVGGIAVLVGDNDPTVSGPDPDLIATTVPPPDTAKADDEITFVSDDYGFEITYPASWFRAEQRLAPELTTPPQQIEEAISLGTYPLRSGGGSCPHVPVNALLDLDSGDVLISIILGDTGTGDEWPETFGSDSFPTIQDPPIAAETCSGRSDIDYRLGVFTLDGRQVQIFVAFGDSVDDATRARTWHILDSFTWTDKSTATTTTTTPPPVADPAAGPLFGDPSDVVLLFDDGLDGVLALDPDNRIGSRSVVAGQEAGDQPYRLTRVGGTLVVGWGGISATSIATGEATFLGDATIYVPAAEPDRVWLIDWPGGAIGQGTPSAWQVDTTGNQLSDPIEISIDGYPAIGIPGGLALETDNGIQLWYPDGREPVDLGPGSILTADETQVAYCVGTPCIEVRVADLTTGDSQSVYSDLGFSDFNFGGPTARFSPGGQYLALTSNRGGVVIFNTVIGTTTQIIDQLGNDDNWYTFVAWAPDGHQLFASTYSYGESHLTLARYDLERSHLDAAQLPFGGTIDFLVLSPDDAVRFLDNEEQSPRSCPPGSGGTEVCGFRY